MNIPIKSAWPYGSTILSEKVTRLVGFEGPVVPSVDVFGRIWIPGICSAEYRQLLSAPKAALVAWATFSFLFQGGFIWLYALQAKEPVRDPCLKHSRTRP